MGKTKRTEDGADFRAIHPLGLVPALEIEGGEILTENAAILQLVADRFPGAELAPRDALGRARLQQWLCFTGTELHKALYVPLVLVRQARLGEKLICSVEHPALGGLERVGGED